MSEPTTAGPNRGFLKSLLYKVSWSVLALWRSRMSFSQRRVGSKWSNDPGTNNLVSIESELIYMFYNRAGRGEGTTESCAGHLS